MSLAKAARTRVGIRWLTAAYVSALAAIVYLADHQLYAEVFSAVRAAPGGDKGGHFFLMGCFSLLLNASVGCRRIQVCGRTLLLGSVIVCVAVTLEETSQLWLRHRSFDALDLVADYAGIWAFARAAEFLVARRGHDGAGE